MTFHLAHKRIVGLEKNMRDGFLDLEKRLGDSIEKIDNRVDDLARMTQAGFTDLEERLGNRIDSLARMTQAGFSDLEERFGGRMNSIDGVVVGKASNDEVRNLSVRVEKIEGVIFNKKS